MIKPTILCLLIVSLFAISNETFAQRKAKPRAAAASVLSKITPKYIKEILLGEVVNNWTFESGEPIEVEIESRKYVGAKIVTSVWVDTRDVTETYRVNGRLRITFSKSGSNLIVDQIESISFDPEPITKTNSETYTPPQAEYLLNGSIAVQSTGWWFRSFAINERNGNVTGRFQAVGGSNDIHCYIVDADGYTNFKNGNQFQAYYNSGKVTVSNINVNLPPGIYYLVFGNRHSLTTPKTVYGSISLNR